MASRFFDGSLFFQITAPSFLLRARKLGACGPDVDVVLVHPLRSR